MGKIKDNDNMLVHTVSDEQTKIYIKDKEILTKDLNDYAQRSSMTQAKIESELMNIEKLISRMNDYVGSKENEVILAGSIKSTKQQLNQILDKKEQLKLEIADRHEQLKNIRIEQADYNTALNELRDIAATIKNSAVLTNMSAVESSINDRLNALNQTITINQDKIKTLNDNLSDLDVKLQNVVLQEDTLSETLKQQESKYKTSLNIISNSSNMFKETLKDIDLNSLFLNLQVILNHESYMGYLRGMSTWHNTVYDYLRNSDKVTQNILDNNAVIEPNAENIYDILFDFIPKGTEKNYLGNLAPEFLFNLSDWTKGSEFYKIEDIIFDAYEDSPTIFKSDTITRRAKQSKGSFYVVQDNTRNRLSDVIVFSYILQGTFAVAQKKYSNLTIEDFLINFEANYKLNIDCVAVYATCDVVDKSYKVADNRWVVLGKNHFKDFRDTKKYDYIFTESKNHMIVMPKGNFDYDALSTFIRDYDIDKILVRGTLKNECK